MESRWLPLTAVMMLLGSCASDSAPPSPAGKQPASQLAPRLGDKQPNSPKVDAFGLPLVIVIDVPEVPKEIQGPSPPIQREPKHSGKS